MRKSKATLLVTDQGHINLESWLQHVESDRKHESKLMREAAILARFAGEDHATPNGESCLHQGLAMAEILMDLNLDDETLAAAIVYSSVQFAGLNLDDVTDHLGHNVAKLIKGTHQMEAIHSLHGKLTRHAHLSTTIGNLRKMMLAIVDDVRVVLIKLVEQLCILRNLTVFNDKEKRRIAQETMDIYAPLANRLGVGHLKWQLEDLSFRYLTPDEYQRISKSLNVTRIERDDYVDRVSLDLKKILHEVDLKNFEVTGRAKHIYSIYRKMQKKDVDLNKIYDVIAFRVLVPTIADCYTALSGVHAHWKHISEEFDDYINKPKPNGYRSIHTAVIGPNDRHVEIQIRTFEMHQEAELGVAAHWIYKEGPAAEAGYEAKINWLRKVMDWQKEVAEMEENKDEIYSHLFEEHVYVFTPNGDVIDLPKGATPLDFAYQIHSELGNKCRGAKVNGVMVPLIYSLKTGDKVDILTTKKGQPSLDWLNPNLGYLKTSRAKAKVLSWFRKQDYDKNLLEGEEILEKELKRLGLKEVSFDDLASQLKYKMKEDMFSALARGDLRLSTVLNVIQKPGESFFLEKPTSLPEAAKLKSTAAPTDLIIEGVRHLLTHMAGCCKPIPGDDIIGYVTINRGVSIHRRDCSNLNRTRINADRLLTVLWGSKTRDKYEVDLVITALDQQGLMRDITSLLASERIPVLKLNAVAHQQEQKTYITLTLEIDSLNPLSRILTKLQQLPNVIEVKRQI